MDLGLDDILNIQRCEFCGKVVAGSQNYYAYAVDGQTRVAHLNCSSVKELVGNWGLALRLQAIPMLLGD